MVKVPWYVRIPAKVVVSRLPIDSAMWRRLGRHELGPMKDPAYAIGVFSQHYERTPFARKSGPFVGLELGPGHSLVTAVAARAHGAERTIHLDCGRFFDDDVAPYRAAAGMLAGAGRQAVRLDDAATVDEVLAACNASFLGEGLASLDDIADRSVDFIWSHTVLQHIRRAEIPAYFAHLRRVLRDDGACSHRVDLRDMLGGALNNLRFPARVWEAEWMARSGFYTNRLGCDEMIGLFRGAGSMWSACPPSGGSACPPRTGP